MQKFVLRIKFEFGIIKAVLQQQRPVLGDRLSSSGDNKNIPSCPARRHPFTLR